LKGQAGGDLEEGGGGGEVTIVIRVVWNMIVKRMIEYLR
jgi:hypothetical protein